MPTTVASIPFQSGIEIRRKFFPFSGSSGSLVSLPLPASTHLSFFFSQLPFYMLYHHFPPRFFFTILLFTGKRESFDLHLQQLFYFSLGASCAHQV